MILPQQKNSDDALLAPQKTVEGELSARPNATPLEALARVSRALPVVADIKTYRANREERADSTRCSRSGNDAEMRAIAFTRRHRWKRAARLSRRTSAAR